MDRNRQALHFWPYCNPTLLLLSGSPYFFRAVLHGSVLMDYYVRITMFGCDLPIRTRDLPLMPRRDAKLAANRRSFLKTTLIGSAAVTLAPIYPALGAAREIGLSTPAPDIKPFELDEITISGLQDGMKSGKFTAR